MKAADTITPEPSEPSDNPVALGVKATTESISVIVATAGVTVNPDTDDITPKV